MMTWEHLVIGDLESAATNAAARLEAPCGLLAEPGRKPLHPGLRRTRPAAAN